LDIQEHVELLQQVSTMVEPVISEPIIRNDPKDEPVLYTAVQARAEPAGCKIVLPGFQCVDGAAARSQGPFETPQSARRSVYHRRVRLLTCSAFSGSLEP
jgi:hypothetical protein